MIFMFLFLTLGLTITPLVFLNFKTLTPVAKIEKNEIVEMAYTDWIASDGSEVKFGEDSIYWYQKEGVYDDNYYYGEYEFYIGEEAVSFITTDLASYGVTKAELEDLFDRNEEYSVENFVVFDIVYDGLVIDGELTVPSRPQIPLYGFILEDDTYLDVANMNTGTYYKFTKK